MYMIDGLQAGHYDRPLLEEMVRGAMSAVTVTLGYWEDALETMDAIVAWNDLARENSDLIAIAHRADDITAIADSGRTAIILGMQNASPIQDRLGYIELFRQMGLMVMQLTYNNQNAIGGSCFEPSDSGLSRFGREVVREMNRVGMLIDLSHVGERTGVDAIELSSVPVAITHANPSSLYAHARNKSDGVLRTLAANGGVLGLNTCKYFNGAFVESARSWVDLVSRTIDIIGVDAVAVGTDFGPNVGEAELRWMRNGRWTRSNVSSVIVAGGPPLPEEWLSSILQFDRIAHELRATERFSETEIEKVMGGNWLRLYRQVLGGPARAEAAASASASR